MRLLLSTLLAVLAATAQAADNRAADLVARAFTCQLPDGQAPKVIEALHALHAAPGRDADDFVLPTPILVFGLPVTRVNAAPSGGEGPDSYIAILPGAKLQGVASAAGLAPSNVGFKRESASGTLMADVHDRTDVWLSCTPR